MTDTPHFYGGRSRGPQPNPDGLKFRKVALMAYEVIAPWGILGTVGRDRDQSWWADSENVTTYSWRNRAQAARSLIDDNHRSDAYREAANGPDGDPFAGLS